MAWQPTPPRFLRRWAIQGVRPAGDRATTIFDLREDRAHVAVYPATVDTFALLIDSAAVHMLLTTLESGNACAVPGIHAIHGQRLLGLRPYDQPAHQGPMELYVHLPGDQMNIIYARDRLRSLHEALTEILGSMR